MRQEKGTAKRHVEQFTLCVQNVSEIERCAGAKAPFVLAFVGGPKRAALPRCNRHRVYVGILSLNRLENGKEANYPTLSGDVVKMEHPRTFSRYTVLYS